MIGGDGSSSHGLSPAAMDAIGYTGGCVLAICLIPQIGKIVITRSARDISYAWSVLYLIGTCLSLVYLVLKDAMAAWIPLVIEIAGCLCVICLKTLFEHTRAGRSWSVAQQQQQLQAALSGQLDASVHSLPGISHCVSMHGAAAAEVEGSVGKALAAELNASKRGTPQAHLAVTCSSAEASPFAAAAAAAANAHVPASPGRGTSPDQQQQQQQQAHAQGLFAAGWAGLQPVHPLLPPPQQQQQQRGVPHWMEGHTGAVPGL
ncbi:hypothetical protein COO60DRAFT_140977 [Scenedesmus sp. NREL 46B-D3]|nr:hypothetical protein COO60DRAFT_140977 [Scenedesmus sp. NREL 46B-D3]